MEGELAHIGAGLAASVPALPHRCWSRGWQLSSALCVTHRLLPVRLLSLFIGIIAEALGSFRSSSHCC
jgi:hypothetical protein